MTDSPESRSGLVARYEREGLEVERYKSESFWDARYHRSRMAVVREIMRASLGGGNRSFLDCGCGTGEYLSLAAELGATTVAGVDLAYSYVHRVRTTTAASVAQSSLDALPFEDRRFDVVLCSEVLEHIPDTLWPDAVGEMFRVAADTVVVTTPNYGFLRALGNRFAREKVAALDESVGHIAIYRLADLRNRLRRSGWRTIHVRTLHVIPHFVGEGAHLPRSFDGVVRGMERGLARLLPKGGNISVLVFRRDAAGPR